MIEIPPPGSFCQNQALLEIFSRVGGKTFLEVGVGNGELAQFLCGKGYHGSGVDFSATAVEEARTRLQSYLKSRQFHLLHADFETMPIPERNADIALSMMVMEHVEDDVGFVKKLISVTRPGGHVIIGVPGRMDRWSFEDETVGHLRRYEKKQLETLLRKCGLQQVEVWSVSVPVANLLFSLSCFLVRNSQEKQKLNQTSLTQTQTSGIRKIPFKTVFPAFFRLFLNSVTLRPLFWIQRCFYRTDLGLTLIAFGRVS